MSCCEKVQQNMRGAKHGGKKSYIIEFFFNDTTKINNTVDTAATTFHFINQLLLLEIRNSGFILSQKASYLFPGPNREKKRGGKAKNIRVFESPIAEL